MAGPLATAWEQDQSAGPAGMLNPAHNPHPDIIFDPSRAPAREVLLPRHPTAATASPGPTLRDPDGGLALLPEEVSGGVG